MQDSDIRSIEKPFSDGIPWRQTDHVDPGMPGHGKSRGVVPVMKFALVHHAGTELCNEECPVFQGDYVPKIVFNFCKRYSALFVVR
jgi:hypothetical protein